MTVDKSPQRVRRMFGEIAPRYDLLNRLLSAGVDRYWRWRTVRLTAPKDGGPVLDVCTGTADLALAYWRAGRGSTRVVGADFCRPMLVLGRRKVAARGAARAVELIEADAQQLPFADAMFSVVSVAFGLRNVADTDRGRVFALDAAQQAPGNLGVFVRRFALLPVKVMPKPVRQHRNMDDIQSDGNISLSLKR